MRLWKKLAATAAALVLAVVGGGALWLAATPPDLLRVGDGYAAKIVCSNTFLAGRDPEAVLSADVQAPGNPLLRLVRVEVDRGKGLVTARILGLFAANYALYRPGLGCTSVPDGRLDAVQAVTVPAAEPVADRGALWPSGEWVAAAGDGRLSSLLADADLGGPGMRAIVAVKDGRIVAEAYGDGFDKDTPLVGWSMTKTVTATIIGRLMLEGRLAFDDSDLLPQWHGDGRAQVRLGDLLAMESGLAFNEDYGAISDVTRMLYLTPDMAAMAESAPQAAPPGTTFHYSTGTALVLSRLWMDRFADPKEATAYPRAALFNPLGMSSATFEVDEHGTFVGGSYLYATARDWARLGQFLLQDGVWNGRRLLPEGFVTAMRTPTKASDGAYTRVQAWIRGPNGTVGEAGVPADAFWLEGHDGQTITIVPSANLVLVRLGLTPSWLGYRPQGLLEKVLEAMAVPQAAAK